uniref:Uncharacterized protein n=1 Tax=Fagus sylvatica TaxID=28930 RepID=A0A2N9GJB9_FAGSY
MAVWDCGVADLEVFVAWVTCDRCWAHEIEVIGVRGCRREDCGGHKGFAVGFGRGLGVLMGASVGLGFGYLGGVVVCADLDGLRREVVYFVGH